MCDGCRRRSRRRHRQCLPPSGSAPALVVATPAAKRLHYRGGVARNARRSMVTEDHQGEEGACVFPAVRRGGRRRVAASCVGGAVRLQGPQHIECFVPVVQILDALVPQMMVGGGRPNLAARPRAGSLRSSQRDQVLKPWQSSLSLFSPSQQMMHALVKVLVVELVLRMEESRRKLTRRIQQRSAEQFSDPQVRVGGETCGGRQNLHPGATSSTILLCGGTCGVPPSSFPRLISSAMSSAPVQNSVQCVDIPVVGATGIRRDFQGVLRGQGFAQHHHPSCAADDERTGAVQKCKVGDTFLNMLSRAICGHFQLHSQRMLKRARPRLAPIRCNLRRTRVVRTIGAVAKTRDTGGYRWACGTCGSALEATTACTVVACVLHVATSGLRWQLFEMRGL